MQEATEATEDAGSEEPNVEGTADVTVEVSTRQSGWFLQNSNFYVRVIFSGHEPKHSIFCCFECQRVWNLLPVLNLELKNIFKYIENIK